MKTRHKLSYCGACQTLMVLCGACGNNSCNGGSGEVHGEPCQDCSNAYDVWLEYGKDRTSVEFSDYPCGALNCSGRFERHRVETADLSSRLGVRHEAQDIEVLKCSSCGFIVVEDLDVLEREFQLAARRLASRPHLEGGEVRFLYRYFLRGGTKEIQAKLGVSDEDLDSWLIEGVDTPTELAKLVVQVSEEDALEQSNNFRSPL